MAFFKISLSIDLEIGIIFIFGLARSGFHLYRRLVIKIGDLDGIFRGLPDPVDRDVYRLTGSNDLVIRDAEVFQNICKGQYRFFIRECSPAPTRVNCLCGYFLQKTSRIH